MHEIPFLRDNILDNIWNNFRFYFMYDGFIWYFLFTLIFLAFNCLIVRFCFFGENIRINYNNIKQDSPNTTAKVIFVLSVALYIINIFSLDLGIFNNYDQMVSNNISDMHRGTLPIINSMRFNPIAGIDHNIVYGISHNYIAVAIWVILKQLLCLGLMYVCLTGLSPTRRLVMLAVINFLPAIFWVNSIVYSEQNALICVFISLYFMKKIAKKIEFGTLFGFAFFVNLALYTKETNILFYFGILLFLVLTKVFNEQITLKSFVTPIKTLRNMPVEYLLFISMLLFSIYYFLLRDLLTDGAYVRHHQKDLGQLVEINALEILICIIAIIAFLRKMFNRQGQSLCLMEEGTLLGSVLILVFVIFYIRIACFPDTYKTWYMYLPCIFMTYYIFQNSNKSLFFVIPAVVIASAGINISVWNKETGKDRAQLAFIAASLQPRIFYVCLNDNNELWKFECFNSAMKYLYPDTQITFKTNYTIKPKLNDNTVYFPTKQAEPQTGEYIIVNKQFKNDCFSPYSELIFENKSYQIYKMK